MSVPLTVSLPEVGRSMAAIIFSSVDLPAPEGPAKKINSPFFTDNVMSRRA